MIRANAERDIAAVQDFQAVRDRAVCQLPCDTVRVDGPTFAVNNARNLTVATNRRCRPKPTGGSFVDFGPEPLFNGDAQRAAVAVMRTVALRAGGDELTATSRANNKSRNFPLGPT